MMIARVFPRRTKATPNDAYAFVGDPPFRSMIPNTDEVHISVTFTWDMPEAERLAHAWRNIAPVKIGGPGTGQRGEEFMPGRYLKNGYTITSRGCPNKCWFCSVWKRDGALRELPITEGWNVLDDNMLACSEPHIRSVFDMLKRQPKRAEFTGGLEAKRLRDWHVNLFADLNPLSMFFAYDTADDHEPLIEAGKLLRKADMAWPENNDCRAYVLCGYPKDTLAEAEVRMVASASAGFMPYAMLWRDDKGKCPEGWKQFQRSWLRPAAIKTQLRMMNHAKLA